MVKKNNKDIDGMFTDKPQVGDAPTPEMSKDGYNTLLSLERSSSISITELLKMYDESYEELKTSGVKENLEHLAINGVKNRVRKLTRKITFTPKAKATAFTGFIIGDAGLWDKAEQVRNEAKRYVDKYGIEAAIEGDYINADNQVLDRREQVFGRPNPDYLKPLKETLKLRTRTLYLIARKNGEEKYKYGTIQTNDNALALGWGKIKFFVPCQTFGIIKEELDDEFKLNSSQAQDTISVFKAVKEDIDIDKIFMDTIGSQLTPVNEVEKRHELTKDAWDRRIFVRGIVTWINRDRPSPWGSVWMGLMSDTEDASEVRINVPPHLSIDFGEESEVIVIGKTRRTKTKDEDDKLVDADVVVDAVGLYPIKGLTTPSEVGKAEQLEDDTMIEGWVS